VRETGDSSNARLRQVMLVGTAHRFEFSRDELAWIKQTLDEIRGSDRTRQKSLRQRLRNIGFYISDFATDQSGFTASDVDRLVRVGTIEVAGEPGRSPTRETRRFRSHDSLHPTPHDSVVGAGELKGHQVRMGWMGQTIITLDDLLKPGLVAVCIGINPAPPSVKVGHYYQGRLGQQFFSRLRLAGLLAADSDEWEDDIAFANGIGFTDIVKRPTAGEKDIRPEEFDVGGPLLTSKLEKMKPELVVFSFKKSAKKLLGGFEGNGFIGKRVEGADVFVMPGPYASGAEVDERISELRKYVAERAS
jgi:TDG/mug DNA glycosylase family protein